MNTLLLKATKFVYFTMVKEVDFMLCKFFLSLSFLKVPIWELELNPTREARESISDQRYSRRKEAGVLIHHLPPVTEGCFSKALIPCTSGLAAKRALVARTSPKANRCGR